MRIQILILGFKGLKVQIINGRISNTDGSFEVITSTNNQADFKF